MTPTEIDEVQLGTQNGKSSRLKPVLSDEPFDLLGIGFGPANLALAIALHDALANKQSLPGLPRHRPLKVLFLERQPKFAWHRGMLLPGTKMQISFVKDFATLRDPTSKFTFLNYLHNKDRLVQFTNLSTFLPDRIEYHDYMEWCASFFHDVVQYGMEAVEVKPVLENAALSDFAVQAKNTALGQVSSFRAKHVVIAVGGRPNIPAPFPLNSPRVLHSSQYATHVGAVLPDPSAEYNVAVIGAGQSAAEIFHDLHSRFPNSKTKLIFRGSAMRPSDDSPFVNEIFDPDRVDEFYSLPPDERHASLMEDKATNYGVVRIGLLEEIYAMLYTQRMKNPDRSTWPHQICNHTTITECMGTPTGVHVRLMKTKPGRSTSAHKFDAIIVAAGYARDAHESMLAPCRKLSSTAQQSRKYNVRRNYEIDFEQRAGGTDAGVWLQGCNENTHGLSDTLLSVLAIRGSEMVQSIFASPTLETTRAKL